MSDSFKNKLNDQLAEAVAAQLDLERALDHAGIPVPKEDLPSLLKSLRAVKNTIDKLSGASGDATEKALNIKDLINTGLVAYSPAFGLSTTEPTFVTTPGAGGGGVDPDPPYEDPRPDFGVPPTLVDLTAAGTFHSVILTWGTISYQNYAYTEVWRNTSDNLGSAAFLGTTVATLYVDTTATPSVLYYYWVRDANFEGVLGAFNKVEGTSGGPGIIGTQDLGPLIVEAENLATGSVNSEKIAPGSLNNAAQFSGAIEPITIVGTVPSVKLTTTIFSTSNLKLLRWNGGAYVTWVDAADIAVNKIEAGQINTGAIRANHLAADSIAVGTLAVQNGAIRNLMIDRATVDKLQVVSADIVSLNADKITASTIMTGVEVKSTGMIIGGTGFRLTGNGEVEIRDTTGTRVLNLQATGTQPIIKAGTAFQVLANGSASFQGAGTITGGSFTSHAWPAAGTTGFIIGPLGLLLGNYNGPTGPGTGFYFEIDTTIGYLHMPGMSITSNVATFSGAITGSVFQTATTGKRVVINEGGNNEIRFYGNSNEQLAAIGITPDGSDYVVGTFGSASTTYIGVYGRSSTDIGVYGRSTQLHGVQGIADGAGVGVIGASNSGSGVVGNSSSGWGGYFSGNSTKSALFLTPVSSLPSNREVGGVCMLLTSDGFIAHLCYADGTNWRYVSSGGVVAGYG